MIVAKHRSDRTPGATPVHLAPYQVGPKDHEFRSIEINRILKQKVIEPATTGWAAPIVFAPKKDGTLCFCIGCGG